MEAVVEVPQVAMGRYTTTAQFLHWLTAVLMVTVLPLAGVMVSMKAKTPCGRLLFTLHKSVGLTILALAAMPVIWSAFHSPPPLRQFGPWEGRVVLTSHWLLYFAMV